MPGRFIFEPITPGSAQFAWLRAQVAADDAGREARLRLVLCHHPPYAQGTNAVPLFGEPLGYRSHQIHEHLVPRIRGWADLVLSGHNHALNHHHVDGVHYLESSHMGPGKPPYATDADGLPAREPLGHAACFYTGDAEATYFSVLEAIRGGRRLKARVSCYRVSGRSPLEETYGFIIRE
jgi:hypothetical protein